MAERRRKTQRDSSKKISQKNLASADVRFEAFLEKSFAELKREIAAHAIRNPQRTEQTQGRIIPSDAVAKSRNLRARQGWGWGHWKYGVAAIALAAIAVPMVMQLNRSRLEERHAAEMPVEGTQGDKSLATQAQADAPREQTGDTQALKHEVTKKRKTDRKQSSVRNEATPKRKDSKRGGAYAIEESSPAKKMSAAAAPPVVSAARDETEMAASIAAEPASAEAKTISPKPTARTLRSDLPAPAAPQLDDAQTSDAKGAAFATTRDEIRAIEKKEMEELWREYEKNPQKFNKDAQRRARLERLLARYDTTARAKRMRRLDKKN